MDPVTLTLMAAVAGGGILSAFGGRKTISPEWLKEHFGASAVNQEMLDLFNSVINSPQGQQLMTQAAEQGQQFERDVASRAAAAGFGGGGGAESGASIFSQAASGGAVGSLQRGVKSNIMTAALPIAQDIVSQRMNAVVGSKMLEQQTPSPWQTLGSGISQAAGMALMAGAGETTNLEKKTTTPEKLLPPSRGTLPGGGSLAISGQVPVPQLQMAPQRGYWSNLGNRLSRFGGLYRRQTIGAQR